MLGRTIPAQDPVQMKMNLTEILIKSQVPTEYQVIHLSYLVLNFPNIVIANVSESTINSPSYPRNPLNELGNYPSGSYPGSYPGAYPGYSGPRHRPGFTSLNSSYAEDRGFVCPEQFSVSEIYGDYVIRVGGKTYPNCGAPCNEMFFTTSEIKFSRIWIGVWAAICMASCLFTVSHSVYYLLKHLKY